MEREEAGEPAAPSPVERATGDDWLAWLNEHGNQMLSYAAARVASRDEAEEVVQDTLLAALRAQKQYEGRSSPKTWLFAILRHKLVDHYRRQKRHQNLEFREDVESALFDNGHWKRTPRAWSLDPTVGLQNFEFQQVLSSCISKLNTNLADVFLRRVVEDRESAEICQELGISQTNLSVRLYRARLAMRECMERNWYGSSHSGT